MREAERAGERERSVGRRVVGVRGGLLPSSSHARLRCYDNIICGQAELLKSEEGSRCTLGWPRTHCLCMLMRVEVRKRGKCAPS